MTIGKRHALLWGPAFLFLVAFVLHVNQIYFIFATLGMLVPLSYLLGRRKLDGIRLTRHARSVLAPGETGTVTLTITNHGRLRQLFLQVCDHLPAGLESPEEGRVLVADLPVGATEQLTYHLRATRRGVYQVGPPTLVAADYLGLFRFTRRVGAPSEVIVYPSVIPVPDLWRHTLNGRAPHKSRRRVVGPSNDLYGVREYTPGDDLRRVDWKTSARAAQLMVVETERAENAEAVVWLDLAAASHQADSIEAAAALAASVAIEAIQRGSTVGLIAHGAENHSVPARPSPRQGVLILEAIARANPDDQGDMIQVLARHEHELPPHAAVVVISPRTGPDAPATAARLRALGHSVTWCAIDAETFVGGPSGPAYEAALAALAAEGARIIRILGDRPLEAVLWRHGSRSRQTVPAAV